MMVLWEKGDINEKELWFLLKSTLFEYLDDKNISFCSNIFFEFFLAVYYTSQNFSVIEKNFFLNNGKVIVQYVNIVALLMNIIHDNTKLYKKISKLLKQETSAYILLTDYLLLSSKERYGYYKEILEEFDKTKNIIYYSRFSNSYSLFFNVSLSTNFRKKRIWSAK